MYITSNSLKKFSIVTFVLLLSLGLQIVDLSAETDESKTKQEITEPVVDEESKEESKTDAQDTETLAHIPLRAVQFCQGKYKKKGIGGIEIITVQCPEAESSCNCEVTKKNLRERVNCGGVIKNASKGSNLESCHSQIVGN